MKYKDHPIANILPLMSTSEIKELAEDIKNQGLKEPIVLLDNMILDGRNRYRACEQINIEPQVAQFKGSSPIAYVLSLNVKRRHLTASQKAAVAVDAEPFFAEEAKKRQLETLKKGAVAVVGKIPQREQARARDRKVVFWEVGETETLVHKTIYDAIKAWIEQKYDPEQDPTKPEMFPRQIEVVGFARMTCPDLRDKVIDWVLDEYDEELGDPDFDGSSKLTDPMVAAANRFMDVMEQEYEPFQCEEIERRTIDLSEYFCEYPDLVDGIVVKFEC